MKTLKLSSLVVAVSLIVSCGLDGRRGEQEAAEFGKRMGMDVKAVNCTNEDSDGDGYVSCTLSVSNPDKTVTLVPLECAAAFSVNKGCRLPKLSKRW